MTRAIKLEGRRFYRLRVVKLSGRDRFGHLMWECICDCGKTIIVLSDNLIRNGRKSCGCYNDERIGELNKRHGMGGTRMFKIWCGVRKRCNNPNTKSYNHYGGRGIKICERWDKYESFYEDMKHGYSPELTLERIDFNGNYEPNNCRWATSKDQARNKRNNRLVELDGRTLTLSEWEEISGTGGSTISWRIKNNWPINDAIYGKPVINIKEISKYLIF